MPTKTTLKYLPKPWLCGAFGRGGSTLQYASRNLGLQYYKNLFKSLQTLRNCTEPLRMRPSWRRDVHIHPRASIRQNASPFVHISIYLHTFCHASEMMARVLKYQRMVKQTASNTFYGHRTCSVASGRFLEKWPRSFLVISCGNTICFTLLQALRP